MIRGQRDCWSCHNLSKTLVVYRIKISLKVFHYHRNAIIKEKSISRAKIN